MENSISVNNKREKFIDIAKGIAILLMVIGHMNCNSILRKIIFSFHMPFFFIIHGYFSKDYKIFSQEHKKFIIKNVKRLIVPYYVTCFCVIVFAILLDLLSGNFDAVYPDFVKWGLASLYGHGAGIIFGIRFIGAVWFLWAMFFGSVIFSFFSESKYSFLYALILFFIGYFSSKKLYLPLSIQSGLTSIIFIWIGRELKKINKQNFLNANKFNFAAVAFGIWWLMFMLGGNEMAIVENYYNFIPANIIGGTAGTVFLLYLSIFIVEKIPNEKFFTFFGKYSLIILCIHLIDLDVFPWYVILHKILRIPVDGRMEIVVHFVLRVFIYFVGTYIIIRTPLKKLFGMEKEQKVS